MRFEKTSKTKLAAHSKQEFERVMRTATAKTNPLYWRVRNGEKTSSEPDDCVSAWSRMPDQAFGAIPLLPSVYHVYVKRNGSMPWGPKNITFGLDSSHFDGVKAEVLNALDGENFVEAAEWLTKRNVPCPTQENWTGAAVFNFVRTVKPSRTARSENHVIAELIGGER